MPSKKKPTKKKNIDNIGAEVFGRSFESIKHTIPEYELDIELIHNVVRAELAVIKAEEEKKAADEQRENAIMERSRFICFSTFINDDGGFYENIKDIPLPTEWYSYKYLNKKLKQLKGQYTKYIIKSIILSLGLGATIMFLILNK